MRICPNCNCSFEDVSAKFCPSCGTPVESKKVKLNKTWIIAGAVICLILITGIVFRDKLGLIFPFLRSGTAFAATLAPENTELFFVIDPDLTQLKNYERIKDIYLSVPEVKKALDDVQDDLKRESDINFENDVKPWLGSEAALIMPEVFTTGKSEPDFLIAVAAKDKKKAEDFAQKLRREEEKSGSVFRERNYNNVTITVENKPGSPLVYALVKNHIMFSNSENLMCQTIDKYLDKGNSLASNDSYKEAMSKLPKSRSGALYIDVDSIAGEMSRNADLRQFDQLEAYNGVGMSLSFVDEGVRIDYSIACDEDNLNKSKKGGTVSLDKTTEIIPGDALAYAGVTNLDQGLEDFISSTKNLPGYSREISNFERDTGLNPERDILSWMNGIFAIAFLPDNSGLFGEMDVPFGIIALIGTDDSSAASGSMKTLANALVRQGARRSDRTFNNQEVHYLLDPLRGAVLAGYGIRDDFLVIGSSSNMLEQGLGTNKNNIAGNPGFKKATADLSSIEDGCVFIDVEKATSTIYNSLDSYDRQEFNRSVYPYLKPVKTLSMGVESTKSNGYVDAGSLLVCIDR